MRIKEKRRGDEVEVGQAKGKAIPKEGSPKGKGSNSMNNLLEIESIAESLGAIDILNKGKKGVVYSKEETTRRKKWTRRKGSGK